MTNERRTRQSFSEECKVEVVELGRMACRAANRAGTTNDERPVAPEWFSFPATTELPMGTPAKVRSLGENGSPYGFAMGARRARRAAGVFGGEPVRLIASTGEDPASARWAAVPSGARVRVATPGRARGGHDLIAVEIASYGEELVRLVLHPESKMLGSEGGRCKPGTQGLLSPRPVHVAAVHMVGKEGNRLDEVATGEVLDPDEVLVDYGDDGWERVVIPAGRMIGLRQISRETRIAWSQLMDLFHGRARPHAITQALVTATAVTHAAQWLASAGIDTDREATDQLAVLTRFLARAGSDPRRV